MCAFFKPDFYFINIIFLLSRQCGIVVFTFKMYRVHYFIYHPPVGAQVVPSSRKKYCYQPHSEFLRRFEQDILPKGFVKIRHAGYLHSKNKMDLIAAVCKQLELPAQMQRAHTPVALRLPLKTGTDITGYPVCGKGRMELIKTFNYHNGALVHIAQLRNRSSPKTKRKYAAHENAR